MFGLRQTSEPLIALFLTLPWPHHGIVSKISLNRHMEGIHGWVSEDRGGQSDQPVTSGPGCEFCHGECHGHGLSPRWERADVSSAWVPQGSPSVSESHCGPSPPSGRLAAGEVVASSMLTRLACLFPREDLTAGPVGQ